MLLTCVIRNDKIFFGFMREGTLVASAAIGADVNRTKDEYAVIMKDIFAFRGFASEDFDDAIMASVVPPLTEVIRDAIRLLLGLRAHLIGSGTRTGMTILTENPAELGGDLVAAAVGALEKYKPPMVLLDFGTALTFSAIDENGSYIGCAIAPGIRLSAAALSNAAELLSRPSDAPPKSVIGKNTAESLRCGSIFGSASMIDGMLDHMAEVLHQGFTVIATGDEASTVLPFCRYAITRDDTLFFFGLSVIYERNRRKNK